MEKQETENFELRKSKELDLNQYGDNLTASAFEDNASEYDSEICSCDSEIFVTVMKNRNYEE